MQTAAHSYSMDTSECFMFGKICAYLFVFGNIGKPNPLSIVDLIISSIGCFVLIIFVVGRIF